MPTREQALSLLKEWVESESLQTHCLAVAASMEAYASKLNLSEEEKEKWFICGLLHDFDWGRYPDINLHPKKGCEFLKEKNYPEEIIQAILAHNEKTGIPRESIMAKTLFAVDELSGLVIALAKVRPGNFNGMSQESVKKALKKKEFAAAINRGDIAKGIRELNVNEDQHYRLVIQALSSISAELGF